MTKIITVKVTTQSNLFIGGSPATFEIGGIDLFTVTTAQGQPYIPGSSIKGAVRNIVRDLHIDGAESQRNSLQDTATEIGKLYKEYLISLNQKQEKQLSQLNLDAERKERARNRLNAVIDNASAESIFGIEGFNDTPKLIFNDLLIEPGTDSSSLFSIDSKNTITIEPDEKNKRSGIAANPRTYRVVRPGVTFVGNIVLYRFEQLGSQCEQQIEAFTHQILDQFNLGIYRLGNSGSRGYGRVQIQIVKGD